MITSKDILENKNALKLFALRLTKGNRADADDLLQNTILRTLEKQHLFEEGTSFFRWASKVMFNIFATDYRRKVKFDTQYDPESYLENESVEPDQEILTDWHKVQGTITTLPTHHRDIITMICIQGMSYQEAAESLDIELGTVRSRLSRARAALQNRLEQSLTMAAAVEQDKDNTVPAWMIAKQRHTANA